MNAHNLRTSLEKAETELETKLRKAEKNLRFSAQPETKIAFANDLRKFSAKNKNSVKFPTHTTIVDLVDPSLPPLLGFRAACTKEDQGRGRQFQHHASRFLKADSQPVDFTVFHPKTPSPNRRVSRIYRSAWSLVTGCKHFGHWAFENRAIPHRSSERAFVSATVQLDAIALAE